MQLQSPTSNFTSNHKNAPDSHGHHSPEHREPIGTQESESSSFHYSPERFIGSGTTYGNYKYSSISANPNYSDDSIYGPGYEDPRSSFYGWI
jgi:hypothetical protein